MGKAEQLQEQCYQFLSVCVVFLCVQTMVWLAVFGIFTVCTDTGASDCTWREWGEGYEHCKSALEVDSGRKIPCCTRDLNPHPYCTWLFSHTLAKAIPASVK